MVHRRLHQRSPTLALQQSIQITKEEERSQHELQDFADAQVERGQHGHWHNDTMAHGTSAPVLRSTWQNTTSRLGSTLCCRSEPPQHFGIFQTVLYAIGLIMLATDAFPTCLPFIQNYQRRHPRTVARKGKCDYHHAAPMRKARAARLRIHQADSLSHTCQGHTNSPA